MKKMTFHLLDDGRDFDDEGECRSSDDVEPGDVAIFEEDILLVLRVVGNRAECITHPAIVEMAAILHEFPSKDPIPVRIHLAMQLHTRWMARGWIAAREAGLLPKAQARCLAFDDVAKPKDASA